MSKNKPKPSETPGASSRVAADKAPPEASEEQTGTVEPGGQGEPSEEELALLPGSVPPGSVSCKMRNGDLLTVPAHIAPQIDEWLGDRELDAGRVYEDKVVIVSHPDAQKKVFRPL